MITGGGGGCRDAVERDEEHPERVGWDDPRWLPEVVPVESAETASVRCDPHRRGAGPHAR